MGGIKCFFHNQTEPTQQVKKKKRRINLTSLLSWHQYLKNWPTLVGVPDSSFGNSVAFSKTGKYLVAGAQSYDQAGAHAQGAFYIYGGTNQVRCLE